MFVVHDSGGVADAQPPATGFYPCQDTDSPQVQESCQEPFFVVDS